MGFKAGHSDGLLQGMAFIRKAFSDRLQHGRAYEESSDPSTEADCDWDSEEWRSGL